MRRPLKAQPRRGSWVFPYRTGAESATPISTSRISLAARRRQAVQAIAECRQARAFRALQPNNLSPTLPSRPAARRSPPASPRPTALPRSQAHPGPSPTRGSLRPRTPTPPAQANPATSRPDASHVADIASSRCPASTIFAGWRQSVLPVHLLGLAPLLGSVGPVAGDVKLQDDGVVHDPVNRRGGGHGVGKDALPLREDQV